MQMILKCLSLFLSMFKKRRVLNSTSESEEDTMEVIPKQKEKFLTYNLQI